MVGGLFNCEQRARQVFHRMVLGRLDRAILTGLGGSASISHLAVLLIFATRNGSFILIYEEDRHRAPTPRRIWRPAILRGVLRACLAFLLRQRACGLLASLLFELWRAGGVILGVVLICYAGKYITATMVELATRVREHPMDFSGIPQETIQSTRIANSAAAEVAAARRPSTGARGLETYVFVPAFCKTEVSVQK